MRLIIVVHKKKTKKQQTQTTNKPQNQTNKKTQNKHPRLQIPATLRVTGFHAHMIYYQECLRPGVATTYHVEITQFTASLGSQHPVSLCCELLWDSIKHWLQKIRNTSSLTRKSRQDALLPALRISVRKGSEWITDPPKKCQPCVQPGSSDSSGSEESNEVKWKMLRHSVDIQSRIMFFSRTLKKSNPKVSEFSRKQHTNRQGNPKISSEICLHANRKSFDFSSWKESLLFLLIFT